MNQQAGTGHLFRLGQAHHLQQRRRDVRQAAALTQLNTGLVINQYKGNRVGRVRRKGLAGRIILQLLYITVSAQRNIWASLR